jgi:hypothetical protein
MPVLPRMIGVGMLSMLIGCVGLQEQQVGLDDHSTDHAHNKADGDSIEISVSSRCGVGGGRCSDTKWVLSPTGDVRGTATDAGGRGALYKTVRMQLHSKEAYQECAQLLRSTWFFWMWDRFPGHPQFEGSSTTIEVRFGWRHHVVTVASPEHPSKGFERILDFVHRLEERATKVKPEGQPNE